MDRPVHATRSPSFTGPIVVMSNDYRRGQLRIAAALDVSFVERHFEPLPAAVGEKLEAGAIARRAK